MAQLFANNPEKVRKFAFHFLQTAREGMADIEAALAHFRVTGGKDARLLDAARELLPGLDRAVFVEAIARVVSGEAAPDTVVHETAPGYLLHGRVLRPALVAVAAAPDEDAA